MSAPIVAAGASPFAQAGRWARRLQASGSRVRPSDPRWPNAERWDALRAQVHGRLAKVRSPLADCERAPDTAACQQVITNLGNPYYLGDQPGAKQIWGWPRAWSSTPSAYVVAAQNAQDVARAVAFARAHKLRLVVVGGGHSYQGTSNAADSRFQ